MSKPGNVYVSRKLPKPVMDYLDENVNYDVNPHDRAVTRDEFLAAIKGRDAVLCMLSDRIDAETFDAAGPQCRIFANCAVGYNNIDVPEATRRGVLISNTPDVLTDATADMAWALLMAAARRVGESERLIRRGEFGAWSPTYMLGRDIAGKTLGILGAGRIGGNFAKKAKGWDMKIIYSGPGRKPAFEAETGGVYVDMDTLLRESDFISLHVPLKPETTHLIGEKELKAMKNTAILINTSRGPVVDEKALVSALRTGEIWAAGLDVFEEEPKLAEGLTELENVVLCPHIASATLNTRVGMGMLAAQNVVAVLKGKTPPTLVNG